MSDEELSTPAKVELVAWSGDVAQLAATSIKLRLKRTVEDIIEIGRELTAVKDELPHGQFLPWISAEFEMSDQTAQNFMNVCARFGQKPNYLEFKPTVLYALSAPSTPDSVVEKAIEKAESGAKVTATPANAGPIMAALMRRLHEGTAA